MTQVTVRVHTFQHPYEEYGGWIQVNITNEDGSVTDYSRRVSDLIEEAVQINDGWSEGLPQAPEGWVLFPWNFRKDLDGWYPEHELYYELEAMMTRMSQGDPWDIQMYFNGELLEEE